MSQAPKSAADIAAEMRLFSIRKFSVLVDDSTDETMLAAIPQSGVEGYYSFTLAVEGRTFRGHPARLLPAQAQAPVSDAWLVATNSKAGYALNQFLRQRGCQDAIVFTLGKANVSAMYSYLDFFHGESATVVYITNTFERGYKIHFPIAVRYLLRSQSGEVAQSGQWLIAPNETIVVDSRKMGLAPPFVGYLEIFTDIRHLNGEVTPFLHFNCDYINSDGVTTIHQSGFKPWPAGSRFVRGLVPTDGRSELTVSLLNKPNETPVVCQAELRFTRNGERLTATRELPSIGRDKMRFVNINKVFADELAAGAEGADVVIIPDQPLHRPNFYLHPRGREWSWTAVEHGAALTERLLPQSRLHQLENLGVRPWICAFPILAEAFEIDTEVLYFQDGEAHLHNFTFDIHNETGRLLCSEQMHLEFGQRVNVSQWVSERSLRLDGGLLKISPGADIARVPNSFSLLESFKPRRNPHGSVVICGGGIPNVPFECERAWMWNHPMVPTVHTEQFGKAVVDDEFDTLVSLTNASASTDYTTAAVLDLDVYAANGEMARFRKVIPPDSSITLSIGDLVRDSDLPKQGIYALWIYCRDLSIQAFHILQRRSDHAIGAQHFYYCRFNTLERDLAGQTGFVMPAEPEVVLAPEAVPAVHDVMSRAKRLVRRFV